MATKIGRYIVEASAKGRPDGTFLASANLVWDDVDAVNEQQIQFFKNFATEAEALTHALQQVQSRVQDGKL